MDPCPGRPSGPQARQHQLEQELQHYQDLFDLAPVGYCLLDADGFILRGNLRTAVLLATSRGALTAQPFEQFVLADDLPAYHALIERLRCGATQPTCEFAHGVDLE